MPIKALDGAVASVRVLDDCPSVLSVGKRVMEDGHSFVWWAGQSPQWYLPSGVHQTLRVQNYIPILDDEVSTSAQHGVLSLTSAAHRPHDASKQSELQQQCDKIAGMLDEIC
eukprot:1606624-Amphidinium_carterae.1